MHAWRWDTSARSSATFSICARRGPMWCKSRIDLPRHAAIPALLIAGMLSACSDIYYDRRETVALGADDHIASNMVAQMIDPWPRYVGNKNIAFSGDRMQGAADRYRRNCVIPPYPIGTVVVVLTADAGFEAQARETFGASDQIVLRLLSGMLSTLQTDLDVGGATVVVIDLDAGQPAEMAALDHLMTRIAAAPPVVVITQAFDENVARTLLQMRVADFLIKPVSP